MSSEGKKKEEFPEDRSHSQEAAEAESKSSTPDRDATATAEQPEASSSNSPADQSHGPPATQPTATNAHVQGDWQAVWSPPHNMYYFYNMRTNETTWTNPLSNADASASASTSTSVHYDAAAAAAAQGIDPSLAYLDPSLAAGPSNSAAFTYTAKFNARTGAFARPDARDPEHVSEYERMKRMSGFYFDVDEWQKDVERRQEEAEAEEEAGKKRKKPTKKDLESFKDRKRQKKLAKTAWLRT
ncbi:hypothetical protein DFH11DRAFT_1728191 [Phellopilus nigrolimitatus]|nr:hypothetical protein DFH11DRAFT_1728191 [Phellopilus nigrolimitatus]